MGHILLLLETSLEYLYLKKNGDNDDDDDDEDEISAGMALGISHVFSFLHLHVIIQCSNDTMIQLFITFNSVFGLIRRTRLEEEGFYAEVSMY